MEKAKTSISIPEPFSLKATVLGHGWHECAPMSWCEGGDCLQVIERTGNTPVRVSMQQGGRRSGRVRVNITAESATVDDDLVSLVRARCARMLGADLDLSEFFTLAAEHPKIAPILEIGAGRILRSYAMSENIVKAICATNVNWTQAVKMINRVGQLGPCLAEFRNLNAWPTPKEIAAAGEDYLLNVARVGYRAESILEFCRSVQDGSFDAGTLDDFARRASGEELYRRLTSIRGIGPASAHFLMGQLGCYERLSIDSWTVSYVSRTYFNGRRVSNKQIERVYAPFGRWRHLVWWFEQWLGWDTARSMLRDAGVGVTCSQTRRKRRA